MTRRELATWRKLMLALSDSTPEQLGSDILCSLAAFFLKLGAEQIRRERP